MTNKQAAFILELWGQNEAAVMEDAASYVLGILTNGDMYLLSDLIFKARSPHSPEWRLVALEAAQRLREGTLAI